MELTHVSGETPPAHVRYTTPSDLRGMSALAYGALARHPGRESYAALVVEHAEASLGTRGPGQERSMAFDWIGVATGHLLSRDFTAAARAAERAAAAAETLATPRVTSRLIEWWRLAEATGPPRSLMEMGERILHLASEHSNPPGKRPRVGSTEYAEPAASR
jgi:hypothetical protein